MLHHFFYIILPFPPWFSWLIWTFHCSKHNCLQQYLVLCAHMSEQVQFPFNHSLININCRYFISTLVILYVQWILSILLLHFISKALCNQSITNPYSYPNQHVVVSIQVTVSRTYFGGSHTRQCYSTICTSFRCPTWWSIDRVRL